MKKAPKPKKGRRDYDKISRLQSAALEVLHSGAPVSPDLRELATAIQAIYDGADPRIALGLSAATPGNMPAPDLALELQYEVRAIITVTAIRDGVTANRVCETLAKKRYNLH